MLVLTALAKTLKCFALVGMMRNHKKGAGLSGCGGSFFNDPAPGDSFPYYIFDQK